MGVRNIESRQEGEMVESQKNLQKQGNRDGHQQGNPSIQSQHRILNLNKEKETYQQHQQPANTTTRNPGSREVVHPLQNRQTAVNSSELLNKQGKAQGNLTLTNITPNYDGNLQETERMNMESVRNQNYQTNFPKISSNFDHPVHRNLADKNDPPLGNTDNFPKKDQPQAPAPYTVIQTYADRLRFN